VVRKAFPLLWIVVVIWSYIHGDLLVLIAAIVALPIALLGIRVALILFLRHGEVHEYDWWYVVLGLVTTSPLDLASIRGLVRENEAEMAIRQGCYVRILDKWRLTTIREQVLFAL
jgi:hypothetical protein